MNGIYSTKEQFLASLELLQARQARVQNQITSGFRISKPSDDPAAVGDVLDLGSRIQMVDQVVANLGITLSNASSAESSLQSAILLVEQGIAAAAQGTGSLTGPSERQILANQIDGILQQMVSLSRTQVGGRYIFSGDLSGQPSYAYDPNSPGAVTRLLQPVDTLLVQDATGVAFQASRTAQEIFDPRNADDTPAEGNVFAALRQLYTALRNNDSDAIVDASTALKAAQNGLNQHASFYGTVQNRVRSSVDIAETYQIQQQETLGNLRDTDLAAAALESLQVQTSISAAMASEARRQVGSLFDYLK